MNRAIKNVTYLNRFADFITVFACWTLAFYLRFEFGFGEANENVDPARYFGYGLLVSLVTVITFKNLKLYESSKFDSALKEVNALVKAHFISFTIFIVLSFFASQERLSRLMLGYYLASSTLILVFVKMYFRSVLSRLPIKLVLVGHGKNIKKYYELIKDLKNYEVISWYDSPKELDIENAGSSDSLAIENLEGQQCDSVVIGFNSNEAQLAHGYIEKIAQSLIPIRLLPDMEFAKVGHSFQYFKGLPVISINEPNAKPIGLFFKRLFDLVSCGIGILLISPLLMTIAALVKLTSKGPIFYGQVRMGVDGQEFKMWKFRSMVTGKANKEGWTVKNDPRVTPIGKFLRKTSLDELPQLWNVIVGDMSLVGPRPERPVFVDQFRKEIPDYMLRHKFKAGITGWAQINGWRGDTSIEKRIECDIWYIKNWSFGLDISIIFLTFWKGFVNKNAY